VRSSLNNTGSELSVVSIVRAAAELLIAFYKNLKQKFNTLSISSKGYESQPEQHTLSISSKGYESQPEGQADEYVTADELVGISVQESTVYFSAESDGNSDLEVSQETERSDDICTSRPQPAPSTTKTKGSSEELDTFSRQPCATITAEFRGVASPSTSPDYVSDSSNDEDSEKCPICLATFTAQEIGTTDTCYHSFCTSCLEEWSAKSNTCPVDRRMFNAILVRACPSGEVIRRIPTRPRGPQSEHNFSLEEDAIFCAVCGESDRQDRMISCCGCYFCYHLECLTPPLDTIPLEEWFCSVCVMISSSFEVWQGHGIH
jgi:hypothetical protein